MDNKTPMPLGVTDRAIAMMDVIIKRTLDRYITAQLREHHQALVELILMARSKIRPSVLLSNDNYTEIWKFISGNHQLVDFILSSVSELRLRLSHGDNSWDEFVEYMGKSYSMHCSGSKVISGSLKAELSSKDNVTATLRDNPWLVGIIIIHYSSLPTQTFKLPQ